MSQLKLSHCQLGSEGFNFLSFVLRTASEVVHLDVSSNRLNPGMHSNLYELLQSTTTLVSLDLSSSEGGSDKNVIGSKGLQLILRACCHNPVLQFLNLSGCGISTLDSFVQF